MSVMGYTNNFGELSNFGLVFHVNYLNAVRRAMTIWGDHTPRSQVEARARLELLHSYRDTLNGFNPRARSAHAYDSIVDGNRDPIKGVKWFRRKSEVHIWGFRVHKVIIEPGEYPEGYTGDVSMAKRRMIRMTPLGNYRQFKIIEGRYDRIGVAGLTLTHKDRLKVLS